MANRQTKRANEDLLEETARVSQSDNFLKAGFVPISTMGSSLCTVIKKSVDPIPDFCLKGPKHKDQGKNQGRLDPERSSVRLLGDGLSNVFDDEDMDGQDQLTQIPNSKGKDEACEKPMTDISGFAGKNDQAEGEVHRKGERCGKG